MSSYGALENRPKSGVVIGTIVGVAVLAALIGWFVYSEIAERQRLDAMDYAPLEAEFDALAALSPPLAELERLATPETAPAEFEKALAAAREALAAYRYEARRTGPLPSGRAWPPPFSAAERAADESVQKYGLVLTYLQIRQKEQRNKEADPLALDTNVSNVAGLANEARAKFEELLASMRRQRDDREWSYEQAR